MSPDPQLEDHDHRPCSRSGHLGLKPRWPSAYRNYILNSSTSHSFSASLLTGLQVPDPAGIGHRLHPAVGQSGRRAALQVQLLREGGGHGGEVQPGGGLRHRAGPQRPLARLQPEPAGEDHGDRSSRDDTGGTPSQGGGYVPHSEVPRTFNHAVCASVTQALSGCVIQCFWRFSS